MLRYVLKVYDATIYRSLSIMNANGLLMVANELLRCVISWAVKSMAWQCYKNHLREHGGQGLWSQKNCCHSKYDLISTGYNHLTIILQYHLQQIRQF